MKSLVEEAASIAKAIEKAWIQAGKPATFQVKILEEPKRNLLGFVVKSAKIGLFYTSMVEKPKKTKWHEKERGKYRPVMRHKEIEREGFRKNEINHEKQPKIRWTHEMIQVAKGLIEQSLSAIGRSTIPFSIDPKAFHLHIIFATPLVEDKEKEYQLFRSLSYLTMQAVRTHGKKGFAGFKVILKRKREGNQLHDRAV